MTGFEAAVAAWREAARRAVLDVAAERVEFTPDDVWAALDERAVPLPVDPATGRPLDGRKLGGVMAGLRAEGLIEKTNLPPRLSTRGSRQGGSVSVWTTPGMGWLVPDAVPVPRALRAQVEDWAAARGLTVGEAAAALLKEALHR